MESGESGCHSEIIAETFRSRSLIKWARVDRLKLLLCAHACRANHRWRGDGHDDGCVPGLRTDSCSPREKHSDQPFRGKRKPNCGPSHASKHTRDIRVINPNSRPKKTIGRGIGEVMSFTLDLVDG